MNRATYAYRKSNARLRGYNPRETAVERAKEESAKQPGTPWYVYGGPIGYNGRDFTGVLYVATRIWRADGSGPVFIDGRQTGYQNSEGVRSYE